MSSQRNHKDQSNPTKSRPCRRVVVTGMSILSPLAPNLNDTWSQLINGKSGIKRLTLEGTENINVRIGGQINDLPTEGYINKKDLKKMGRFIHMALISSKMAIQDSGIEITESLGKRTGVIVGSGIGGLLEIEQQNTLLTKKENHRLSPFFLPSILINHASGYISLELGTKGPNYSISSACASGGHAIGEAARYIQDGDCDVMITGATEAPLCLISILGFDAMKALSRHNEEPEKASRPWDKDRDGFVMSEGAGILILEEYEHARQRGARIYAELTGYGASSDAHHISSPSPSGDGAIRCMKQALQKSELNPENIDYVNAHGTSTPMGDAIETIAIKEVFGNKAKDLWMSSTKSMTGHTLGAAGAIEAAISIMSLHKSVIPPTINLDQASPDCDLDYIPHIAREKKINHVLSNSFGFGGTNTSLIFSRL